MPVKIFFLKLGIFLVPEPSPVSRAVGMSMGLCVHGLRAKRNAFHSFDLAYNGPFGLRCRSIEPQLWQMQRKTESWA